MKDVGEQGGINTQKDGEVFFPSKLNIVNAVLSQHSCCKSKRK